MSQENLEKLYLYLAKKYSAELNHAISEQRYILMYIRGLLEFDVPAAYSTRMPIEDCANQALALSLSIASLEPYSITISAADNSNIVLGRPKPYTFEYD